MRTVLIWEGEALAADTNSRIQVNVMRFAISDTAVIRMLVLWKAVQGRQAPFEAI